MREKDALLKKLSAYSFAEKEWNLYLDTHPTDREGLAMHKRMADRTRELTEEYESKFGPLTSMSANNKNFFEWIDEPWPWEM